MIIWHAYMLQPVIYEDDCSRLDVPHMRRVLFPWQAVVSKKINNRVKILGFDLIILG